MNPPTELLDHHPTRELYERVRESWGEITFTPQAEGKPNKYRIDAGPGNIRTASILFKRDYRAKEGLAHELLHLELFRLGYPLFEAKWEGDRQFVSEANNNLQHQVLKPMFLELGFDEVLFESSRGPYTEFEKKAFSQIDALAPFQGVSNYTEKSSEFFKVRDVEGRSGRYADLGNGGIEFVTDYALGQ